MKITIVCGLIILSLVRFSWAIGFTAASSTATSTTSTAGVTYSTATVKFNIGEVYISSTTFPALTGMYNLFASSVTMLKCRAYCETTSSFTIAGVTQWDLAYSSFTLNTIGSATGRYWESMFTSTTPWLNAGETVTNWFYPDITAMGIGFWIAPRILAIPIGALPAITIEAYFIRRLDE